MKKWKGKTWEQIFGKEVAEKMRKQFSDRLKINNPNAKGLSKTHRQKISKTRLKLKLSQGKNNPRQGRCHCTGPN